MVPPTILNMRKLIRHIFSFTLLGFTLTGCYYDKESELYPTPPDCDTTIVTYSLSVAPVMTQYCNTCHSETVPNGNVITGNYNDLYVVAANGQLWSAVNHEGNFPMPQGMDKLPACDLTKIKKWIDAGAPNN
jgi:hypothetical protein